MIRIATEADPNVLEIEIAAGKDLALVWEEEGEILGYACPHDLGFRAYLSDLIVAKTARNRGIGRQRRAVMNSRCSSAYHGLDGSIVCD
jgi:hypothetical protein